MPRNFIFGPSVIVHPGAIHPSTFSVPRFGIAICRKVWKA